jgi:hypothetical protein
MKRSIKSWRNPGGLAPATAAGSNTFNPAVSARILLLSQVLAVPERRNLTLSAVIASDQLPAILDISTAEMYSITDILSMSTSPQNSGSFTDLSGFTGA